MDNLPGMSLFCGSEGPLVDFNAQQPEELEAIEDEKRRNQEIHEMLKDAFDDLEDEDDRTIGSNYSIGQSEECVSSTQHANLVQSCHNKFAAEQRNWCGHNQNMPSNEKPNKQKSSKLNAYNHVDQLEVLYQVRLREIQRLHDENEALKKEFSEEKSQLYNKLSSAREEVNNANIAKQECERLLADERSRVSSLEKEIKNLKLKLRETEKHRTLQDENLSQKYLELQKIHEAILIEKSETVNRLARSLEETQSKYEKLLSSTLNQPNISELQRTITTLQKENQQLSAELRKESSQNSLNESDHVASEQSRRKHTKELETKLLMYERELKDKEQFYTARIKTLESQLEHSATAKKNEVDTLKKENEEFRRALEEKERSVEKERKNAVDEYSKEYLQFHEQKLLQVRKEVTDEFSKKLSDAESKIYQLTKDCNEIKELYTETCILKDKLQNQYDTLKEKNDTSEALKKLVESTKVMSMQVLEEEIAKVSSKYKESFQFLLSAVVEFEKNVNIKVKESEILKQKLSEQEVSVAKVQKELNSVQREYISLRTRHEECVQMLKKMEAIKEKAVLELEKLQAKYENSRKAALFYKQSAEWHEKMVNEEKENYARMVRKVQDQISGIVGENGKKVLTDINEKLISEQR